MPSLKNNVTCSLLVLSQWRLVWYHRTKSFSVNLKLASFQQDYTRFWLKGVIFVMDFFYKLVFFIFFIRRFFSTSLNLDISNSSVFSWGCFCLANVLVMEPSKLLRPLLCYRFLFNSVFFSPLQNQARLPSCSSTYSVSEVYFARVLLHGQQHARPHHFSYFIFLLP